MHPCTATTTTPFSVEDILKLEHHHDFENQFLMTDQVVPMNCEHVRGASRTRDVWECPPEPCVSGGREKLGTHDASAAEEEIDEQGERTHDHQSVLCSWSLRFRPERYDGALCA